MNDNSTPELTDAEVDAMRAERVQRAQDKATQRAELLEQAETATAEGQDAEDTSVVIHDDTSGTE